jgi:acetoin utilization deacetylase AcuC-like enzyme
MHTPSDVDLIETNAPLGAIPVFYTPAMVAAVESYSPSAGKPAAVVASWVDAGFPLSILAPLRVTPDDFKRAHDPQHVDEILAGIKLNGFRNRSLDVATSLPYTHGAMLDAARAAIANRRVAVAPCSGFHHAGYDTCFGYCTFNGLMVTALALREAGEARRVGILDFDEHHGDGTDDIIGRLRLDWIRHYSAGLEEAGVPEQAQDFLDRIPSIVRLMRDCDVLLYQAGADPHIDDPLGGWLTTEQLAGRDRRVFETARLIGLPVAWNLAGGYQQPLRKVLDIHDNTMRVCCGAYVTD